MLRIESHGFDLIHGERTFQDREDFVGLVKPDLDDGTQSIRENQIVVALGAVDSRMWESRQRKKSS